MGKQKLLQPAFVIAARHQDHGGGGEFDHAASGRVLSGTFLARIFRAAKIRRTPESISNIERGQQLPAIDTLIELATVLQVPLSDFFRSFNDQRKLSRERAENETKIEETIRSLSDPAVAIAAEQIKALAKVR
jgi:transcriptional regulator with XRE-family HTH domain